MEAMLGPAADGSGDCAQGRLNGEPTTAGG